MRKGSYFGTLGQLLTIHVPFPRCFIAQCPIALVGLALVLWKLPEHERPEPVTMAGSENRPASKLGRVDFLGAFALVGTILTCLLLLDQGTKSASWRVLGPLAAGFVASVTLFTVAESRIAKEPILPLDLISKRDVFTPYLIVGCQAAGQFGVGRLRTQAMSQ